MTWLKAGAVEPIPTADQLPRDMSIPNTPEALSAATSNAWRNADGSTLLAQETENETKKLQADIEKRLGTERVKALYLQKGFLNPDTTPFGTAPISSIVIDPLLEAARQDAEINPDAWKGVDLSVEGIKARVDQRRLQEHQDEQAIMAMSPHPVAEQFLGGLAANMADPKQWALMAFNPGGGFLKAVGWQGVLGMVGAAANIPSEREVAPALGEEGPDVQHELLMGGLAGLGLEGLARGLGPAIRAAGKVPPLLRGLAYHGIRETPTPDAPLIAAAEAALQADKPVAEAVAPLIAEQPPAPSLPPREPLFAWDNLPPDAPEPTALAPDPVTTEAVPPVPPKTKKPVDLSTFVVRQGGIWKGSDTGEIAALEYKRPGFLKNNKFERSTAGDNGGGHPLDTIREMAVEAGYLPKDATIRDLQDALAAERKGNKVFAQSDLGQALEHQGQEAAARQSPDAPPEPVTKTDTGWNVSPHAYDMAPNGMADLETDLNGYLDTQWPGVKLTASERQEFTSHMMTHGGNAEDVMVSILSRDIDLAETKGAKAHAEITDPAWKQFLDEAVGPRVPEAGASGAGRPDQLPHADGGGAAGAGNGFSVESTVAKPSPAPGSLSDKDIVALFADVKGRGIAAVKKDLLAASAKTGVEGKRAAAMYYVLNDNSLAPRSAKAIPDKGGVEVIGDVKPWVAEIVTDMKDAAGLSDVKIRIVTADHAVGLSDAEAHSADLTPIKNQVSADMRAGVALITKKDGGYVWTLALGNSLHRTSRTMETLAHEIGHIAEAERFKTAPMEERAAVIASFANWRAEFKSSTRAAVERYSDRQGKRLMRAFGANNADQLEKAVGPNLLPDSYAKGFSEWFADMVSRSISTSEFGNGLVSKFFSRIADMWRGIGERLRVKGYINEPVDQWLRTLSDKWAKTDTKFPVESTAIGDQYIVPGTERRAVANRDAAIIALKQQQSKLRRPDQMRVEDDATGLFAAPNLDLFDDMASPQARAYIDQVAADMSMRVDQGFGVDIPPGLTTDEGTQIRDVKGVLDEFAEMDRMEKEFADCMKMGVPDGV